MAHPIHSSFRSHLLVSVALCALTVGAATVGASPAWAANPPVGGGGTCTGMTHADGSQGQQEAYNNGLYTCSSSAWVPQALIVGSKLQDGTAASCGSTTAGMIRYNTSNTTIEYCNSTAWGAVGSGSSVNLGTSVSAANPAISGDLTSGFYTPAASTVAVVTGGIESMRWNTVASGVNYLSVTPAATGSAPILAAAGSDTNIGLRLTPKGTGGVGIGVNPTAMLHIAGPAGSGSSSAINAMTVTGGTGGTNANGGAISLVTGNPGGSSGRGGSFSLTTGGSWSAGLGGNITFTGGNSNSGGGGGTISLTAGGYSPTQDGGSVMAGGALSLGAGGSVTSGSVTMQTGIASAGGSGAMALSTPNAASGWGGSGGSITITAGNGDAAGSGGAITITAGSGGASNINGSSITLLPGAKGGSGTDGNVLLATTRGRVGIGTTSPTNTLSFGGNSARTLWMERHTTAATAGNNLTIQAGGAYSTGSNLNGGNLVLSSGTATGTGSSSISFQTATAGTTGTADRAPATVATLTGSGALGIGTTSPATGYKLGVTGGGVYATGTYTGTAAVPETGLGSRMFFDPAKAAFRAGYASGTEWDASSIGSYSFAVGNSTNASGITSFAIGNRTTAAGDSSFAMGDSSNASGYASFAMGEESSASGDYSFAMGVGETFAIGNASFAAGTQAQAYGASSIAMGDHPLTSGTNSIALGTNIIVGSGTAGDSTGDYSMGIGLGQPSGATPKITGNSSLGIFMGNRAGDVISQSNVMILSGGRMAIGATSVTDGTSLDLSGNTTTANSTLLLPVGTSATRPATGVNGMIRYNSTLSALEGYVNGVWTSLSTGNVGLNLGTSTSATSPQVSGDATSGLYSPASQAVAIATGGTERLRVDSSGNVGIGGAAAAGVALDVGNKTTAFRPAVGTTAQQPTCDGTIIGGMRYDTTLGTIMMCDGSAWRQIIASSGTGATSTPNSGTGYFVVTNTLYSGNLTSLTNANTLCLTDLNANNWLNKSDAASRGLINSSHIQAWMCDGSTCNNTLPSTTYTFAASGSASAGGATFTADSSGYVPGNSQNWAGTNYFGSGVTYWTNRAAGTSTLANAGLSVSGSVSGNCANFSSTGTFTGVIGTSNSTGSGRWNNATAPCSSATQHLICMVHPGSESATTNGYIVMTSSVWDGNLGGRSGANAKCLTELTTNTNWMGYSTANDAGRLTSGKVLALLCDGSACTNASASQTYSFAVVGNSAVGGGTFTTNSSGAFPLDSANWSGSAYFGGAYDWWSNRLFGNGTTASNSSQSTSNTCSAWTSNSSSATSYGGNSANTNESRWYGISATCDQTRHLVCLVNP